MNTKIRNINCYRRSSTNVAVTFTALAVLSFLSSIIEVMAFRASWTYPIARRNIVRHSFTFRPLPKPNSPCLFSSLHSLPEKRTKAELITKATKCDEVIPSTWNEALHRFFIGDIGPPLVVLSIFGFIFARCQLPLSLSLSDLVVSLVAISFWWIQEYFFHKLLLHSSNDWIGKSIHQNHHQKNYFHISIDPPELLLGWLLVAHVILKLALPWHLCLSATVGYSVAGLFYEWSHYIVHTRVRMSSQTGQNHCFAFLLSTLTNYFSQMRNNHIRHHRISDKYWYAFSVVAMDDLFDTNPDLRTSHFRNKNEI